MGHQQGAGAEDVVWRIDDLDPLEVENHDVHGPPRRPTEREVAPVSDDDDLRIEEATHDSRRMKY